MMGTSSRDGVLQDVVRTYGVRTGTDAGAGDVGDALALRATGLGTWRLDFRNGSLRVSDRFKTVLGIEAGTPEWDECSLFDRIHPEDRGRVMGELEAHLDGLWPFDTECQMRTARGEWRWFRLTGCAMWRGTQVLQMGGTIEDMTAQRALEARLRASEERFRSVFETSPVGMVVTDPTGRIVQANPTFAELGTTEQTGARATWLAHVASCLAERGAYGPVELELEAASGDETVAVEARGAALEDGLTLHVIEDIRERRAARARERELRRKLVMASRAAATRLPEGLCRTLRSVFESADLDAALATRAYSKGDGTAATEHLERMRDLLKQVGQQLEQADAAAWPGHGVFQRVEVEPLVTEALRLSRFRVPMEGIRVERSSDVSTPLMLDRSLFVEAIVDLLVAVAEVLHEASTAARVLDVRTTVVGVSALSVTITGNAADARALAQARVDRAREIARRCGGRVTAAPDDAAGRGFVLLLPIDPPDGALQLR